MAKKVVVFAGHYAKLWDEAKSKGIYTNLTSNGVYEEYNSNIVIAREVVKDLRKQSGINVYFPQENGAEYRSLDSRADYCNRIGADTALFIHSNAGSSSAKGAAAFYYHTSADGKRFAQYYADEMKRYGYPLWSGDGIYPCNPNDGWSWFRVVVKTNMPVILTENFFFTNPYELKNYLLDPKELKKIALAHSRATCRYLGVKYNGSSASPSQPVDNGLLGVGDTGEAVKLLQKRLTALGYDTKGIDGDFGPNTNSALKAFQKDAKIDVDGIAGPATFKALDAAEKKKANAEKKAKEAEEKREEEKKAEEARKKAEQAKKEEEDEMLQVAIVINTYNDYPAAELVALKHKAPIYPRKAISGEVAKHIIVVGGNKDGLKADKITVLAGSDRIETVKAVEKYIK